MTAPIPIDAYAIAVGSAPNATMVPFVATYSPTTTTILGPSGSFKIGQMWINSSSNLVFILTSLSSFAGVVTATWTSV